MSFHFARTVVGIALLQLFISVSGQTGRTIEVTSILSKYYLADSKEHNATGNNAYIGFIKDLLDELATKLNIEYELHKVADGNYGNFHPTTGWDGMLGEVVRGDAEIAAAPITVTIEREKGVDFTLPFSEHLPQIVFKSEISANTLDDVIKNPNMEIAFVEGTALKEGIENTKDKVLEQLRLKPVLPYVTGLERLKKENNFALILTSHQADHLLNKTKSCPFNSFQLEMSPTRYALAVPNQSPWRDQINEVLDELKRLGILDQLLTKWMPRNSCVRRQYVNQNGCSIASTLVNYYWFSFFCLCFITYWL